ncbi:diguanylate cyclase (GGDEF) domain protein [Leptospira interrogans serovar Copenhageni str. LT2050]|uniref:Diguanylate cyclase (GGDEF) domain protein n=1 Tax=Leptospira interrogans serovar Copenhageni str. LT2050 TaxID=1001598 RepID=M3IPU4_LEPIT|nr:diguanylate cyclase (GGDEF) domain protein [Leptospira interrogans serovar Copenhageni str. LT2050]
MEVAEKELSYRTQKGSPVKITVSIGACIFGPGEEFSFDDIYHSIDSALYESKKREKQSFFYRTDPLLSQRISGNYCCFLGAGSS